MRIYIRHAKKMYRNGRSTTFMHDPSITQESSQEIREQAANLCKLYGSPDVIICSPYYRCRQTALLLNSGLQNKAPVKCETNISEYLGNHFNVPLDVREETSIYNPPHPERLQEFEHRVRIHNDMMRDFDRTRTIVWIVTHGFVINQIMGYLGFKGKESIPVLSCFIVREHKKKIRGFLIVNGRTKSLRRS